VDPVVETAIDVDAELPPERAPPAPIARGGSPGGRTVEMPAIRDRTGQVRAGAAEPAPDRADPDRSHAGARSTPWDFSPLREVATNLAGGQVVANAARGVVEDAPRRAVGSTTGGVVEALDAHDAAIGLSRSGPLLTALEGAAEDSDAPPAGTATFDVGIEASGHVSVTLLDASSDQAGWSTVGNSTQRAIDPRRVRMPPDGSGWHAVVRVEARLVYPDGLDPGHLGTKVTASAAGVNFTTAGKVCALSLTVGLGLGINGGCDLANIGAHALRVVHGHVVREGRL